MIPDWKLERYLTGDLPADEMREIRELENTDEVFAGRVRMFREDSERILRKMPFETLSRRFDSIEARNSVHIHRSYVNGKFLKFAVAAALVVAFVSMALVSQRTLTPENESVAGMNVAVLETVSDTRIKGMGERMEVWKKTESGIVQMENLGEAREGDEIQLRYSVPRKCFGVLFSMDGNGVVTSHMSDDGRAVALESDKMISLPFAYKLDDAPKFEKFFFLTSASEFSVDVGNIDATLKKDGIHVVSLTLRKVEGAEK